MADVQIDNGNFTQLANVLLEKVSSAKLNGCQHAIILQVWRYTYGFKRKEHELSAGFLAKATGYNQRQIQRDLIVLVDRNIIVQRVINGVSRTLSFNKDFDKWDTTYGELADGEKAIGELTDGELAVIPTANKTGVTYGGLADQERKSFKENVKESTTLSDYKILEDEVLKLHAKGENDLRNDEVLAMHDVIRLGIPVPFIVDTMKQMKSEKNLKGEKVQSFVYYHSAIKERFNKPVVTKPYKKGETDWDKILKQMGDSDSEQNRGA